MALNCSDAKADLWVLGHPEAEFDKRFKAYEALAQFIKEVDHLLKHNSIKQTPALFKPKQ